MREMVRDREGEQETKTKLAQHGCAITHKHTLYSVVELSVFWLKRLWRGDMPHLCSTRLSFLLGSGAPRERLAWCAWLWQVLPSRQRGSATNQTRVVCSNRRGPRTVLGAWSQLGTNHSANHWSRFNCVTLGEKKVVGESRSERHGCSATFPLFRIKP